jgi:O-antigen/teichoic acid export membrane protein
MTVKKNILYNMLLSTLNVLFPIISVPYISRVLGVENVGLVNFIITYVNYFVLFAAFGVNIYGMREIAKYKNNKDETSKIFSEIFRVNLITASMASAIYLMSVFFISRFRENMIIFIIAGIALYLTPVTIDWYFQGIENFRMITLRSLAVKCFSLIGLFVFVRTESDIIPYIMLNVISITGASIWNMIYAQRHGLKIIWRNINAKIHIRPMFIFFITNITISLYTMLNIIMLGFLSDYTQVGYFTSVYKIVSVILSLITAIAPVIIARINIIKGEDGHIEKIVSLYIRSFNMLMITAIPAMTGLIVIAPRFVLFFLGPQFSLAALPMQLLSILILIVGLTNLFGTQILLGLGYEKKYLISVSCGTAISIIFNLLLIRRYGAIGASIATLITEITVAAVTTQFAIKLIPIRVRYKDIYQPAVASLPIIFIALIFNKYLKENLTYLAATVLTGCAVYIFMMLYVFKNDMAGELINIGLRKYKINTHKEKKETWT